VLCCDVLAMLHFAVRCAALRCAVLCCAVLCCAVPQQLICQEIQVLLFFDIMGRHHISETGQATISYHVHDGQATTTHTVCLGFIWPTRETSHAWLLCWHKQAHCLGKAGGPSQPHQQQVAVRQVGQRRLMPRQALLPAARLAALGWARRLRRLSGKRCLLASWVLGTWVSVLLKQCLLCACARQIYLQS